MTRIGAIRTAEFKLFYQPQVTADGTGIAALEALIRHEHPEQGLIPPSHFLPRFTYEELENLDWWVLQQAARDLERWPDLTVSVNVAATQLQREDFAGRALDMILASGHDPKSFELEIVESSVIADFDMAFRNVVRLREAGVRIALDDFGTGYSSLTYLLKFPLDKVKIDRSFVETLHTMQGVAIIQAIVALARSIGLKVTAEGVESAEQQRFLRAIGCHYLQGYFFAKPMPADELARRIASGDICGARQAPPRAAMA